MRYLKYLLDEQKEKESTNPIHFDCWHGQLEYIADDFDAEILWQMAGE